MINNYIKSFVIGASFPIFILFFLIVANLKNKTYSYETYSMIAPLYFGLMNMLSLYLANVFNLNLRERLFYISLLSIIFVLLLFFITGSYVFNDLKDLILYIIFLSLLHLFTYNVTIYYL